MSPLLWLAACHCGSPPSPVPPHADVEDTSTPVVIPPDETGSTGLPAATGSTGRLPRRSFDVEEDPYLFIEPERTGVEAFGLGFHPIFWDADADGFPELLVASKGNTYLFDVPDHPGEVLTWEDALHAFHGQGATDVYVADMNGDGFEDAVLYQEGIGANNELQVYLAPFAPTRVSEVLLLEEANSQIACGDLTGDGIGDIIVESLTHDVLRLFSGPFVPGEEHPPDGGVAWGDVKSADVLTIWPDVTGDGHADLWYNDFQPSKQFILKGPLQPTGEAQEERGFPISDWSGIAQYIPNALSDGRPAVAMTSKVDPYHVAIVSTPLTRNVEELVVFPFFGLMTTPTSHSSGFGVDVDGDGFGDFVLAGTKELLLLLGPFDVEASWPDDVALSWYQPSYELWDQPGEMDFHDLDGDGVLDIVLGDADWGVAIHLVGPQLEEARDAVEAGL